MKGRQVARLILLALLLGGALFFVTRLLEPRTLWETLRGGAWSYALPSTALNALTVGVIVWRWRTLLNGEAGFWACYRANQIGAYGNNWLPFRMGDLIRTWVITRRYPYLGRPRVLASIGAELTLDMAVLMILLALVVSVLPLPPLLTQAGLLLAALTALAVTGVFALAWFSPPAPKPQAPTSFLGRAVVLAWGVFTGIQAGVRPLRQGRRLLAVAALTLLGYAVQIVSNALLLRVFWPSADLAAGLVALVGAGMGLALPLLPGSAGTYQAAVILALSSLGVPLETATAYALLLHGQQILLTALMGNLCLAYEGLSLGAVQKAMAENA